MAVNNVAGAMTTMASSFGAATNIATPTRRQRAVEMVAADESISPTTRRRAILLFTRNIAVCDSYVVLHDPELRSGFLADALEDGDL